jgi:hypothetical protein
VAADWVVLFATTWGVMQFFCSPILGLMSDRWGRRPVILTSIFGLGVDFLFMAFAPSLWWLFVGRVFNGMTAASFSTAGAYVADVTKPENRAKGFRPDGRGVRRGLHLRPGPGRLAVAVRPSAAVPGLRGPGPVQLAVRLLRPAGIAAARDARPAALRLEARPIRSAR